jgi:hypothetical protein
VATHRLPIINAWTKPDNNGDTYFEPMAINFGSNDRYDHMLLAFTSQSAKRGIAGKFTVPKNYVGSAKIIIAWSTTATSGDVDWEINYTAVGGDSAESLDPAADQEAPADVTDTASGTARRRQECEISLTSGNLAADDEVLFNFYRDAAAAGDTLAATAYLFGLFFQYADI